jgi:hypothetical protein
MFLTIRQREVYRHDRNMFALISLSLTVTLSGISCTQADKQYKGLTLDSGNNKNFADLLPPIEDIESITLVNHKVPTHLNAKPYPTAEPPKSDWPGVYSAFRHTKVIITRATLPVYGEALMKTRDGKTYEITIFVLDGKDVVYYIYKQPNPKEIGSPYFMSTLSDELVPDLLPKWQ